ncbi:MAG: DUF5302 domain-containing protein [Propionibacteriaceae bacterium]
MSGDSKSGQGGTESAAEETKRKFREALEKKQQQHSDGEDHTDADPHPHLDTHGPVAEKKVFRRKTG